MLHNQQRGILSSQAITASGNSNTPNGAAHRNNMSRGLHLVVDVTAVTGTTPTLVVTIEGFDSISGKYYTLLASATINSVSTTVLKVYPGLTASANAVANDIVPEFFRVSWTVGGTTPSFTMSIAAALVI